MRTTTRDERGVQPGADSRQLLIHDTELERNVLASLTGSYNAMADTDGILTEDCFYDPAHREYFAALRAVYGRGEAPDMSLVTVELARRGAGLTAADVAGLCVSATIAFDVVPHAKVLRDYAFRRRIWEAGYAMMTDAPLLSVGIDTIQNRAKEAVDGLFGDGVTDTETLTTAYSQLQAHMLANMSLESGQMIGTPTGFPYIDRDGGFCGGELIIVGAETSQGKTSFATALTVEALRHGHGVAFYSMEMRSMQITARIASMQTGIPVSRILNQRLTMAEVARIDRAMDAFDGTKMYFDSNTKKSLDSISLSIRAMKMKHGIRGAVVDYIQLVGNDDRRLNREQAIAACAQGLKNLALELDIWIIAISQLSRAQNPLPTLSRLRDSGQIEQAADRVYLIYRPREGAGAYPDPFRDVSVQGTAMVICGKGRNIGTGEFICGFNGENTLFYPLTDGEVERLRNTAGMPCASSPQGSPFEENVPF